MDLFASIIQPERHHPQFLELKRSRFHAPAAFQSNDLRIVSLLKVTAQTLH